MEILFKTDKRFNTENLFLSEETEGKIQQKNCCPIKQYYICPFWLFCLQIHLTAFYESHNNTFFFDGDFFYISEL